MLDHVHSHILEFYLQKVKDKNICDFKKSRDLCEGDIKYILEYLSQALNLESPQLFEDFTAWLIDLLVYRNIPMHPILKRYQILQEGIKTVLPEISSGVAPCFEEALKHGSFVPKSTETPILPPEDDLLGKYIRFVIGGNRKARELVFKELKKGLTIFHVYMKIFEPAQHLIGRLWQINVISAAQEHYATVVIETIMSELYLKIFISEKNGLKMASFCIGTELHELGIRMVTDFFEMEGWDTSFFGAHLTIPDMLKTLHEESFDLVAISTTMIAHLKSLQMFIQKIREQDFSKSMKIIVGGYPFLVDNDLWEKGYTDIKAQNAQKAIRLTNTWFNV